MNNDIVIRLREIADADVYRADISISKLYEAADEIERLRKLVKTWIICAERLVESDESKGYEKALSFYLDCQRIAKETC